MPKKISWHEMVKEILKEIGKNRGYDVSESEKEMMFAKKFAIYEGDKRAKHTLSYKPDVVWKEGHRYRAVFEVEYVNPNRITQTTTKRKYAIGSLMLAYLAMINKSVNSLVFITNSENLCSEIALYLKLAEIEYSEENTFWAVLPVITRSSLKKNLEDYTINKWKL